jgi:hypothetical protein
MASESTSSYAINYESSPLLEHEIEGAQYRLDAGKHGTALCISQRLAGTWDWTFVGEARWDGSDLRIRALDRKIVQQLSRALAQAVEALG